MGSSDSNRMFAFEDLLVWQKAIDFAEVVIKTIDEFEAPRKHFRIIEQLEAASISISSNIAEGKGRFSKKEFVHYLYIARGSLFETVSLLILIRRLSCCRCIMGSGNCIQHLENRLYEQLSEEKWHPRCITLQITA